MVGRQNRSLTTKQGRGEHQRAEMAAAVQAVASVFERVRREDIRERRPSPQCAEAYRGRHLRRRSR